MPWHILKCSYTDRPTALQGTWCAIDVGLSHKDKEVKDLVKELRKQRVGMVQTSEQYQFVHRVLGNLGMLVGGCSRLIPC